LLQTSVDAKEGEMTRPTRRELLLLLALLAMAALLANHDVARAQQSTKPQVFAEFRSKLALDGYDPVAYFKSGKAMKGSASHVSTWNGATWHFSSADNKTAFEANPPSFAPQFGGYCAWAVSEGYTAKGDPNNWRIVDGKLFVNYNASVQRTWEKDVPGHIAKGQTNWPTVLSK
jgi:YHS domain-containing protein